MARRITGFAIAACPGHNGAPAARTDAMKQPTAMPAAVQRLMTEEVPADSRQARQLSRRQMIAETVMTEGAMRIEDLTDRFGISLMTVHRDLDELVGRGLLRKTRGVVSAAATSLIESSDVYRSSRQGAEKRAIALAAMAYVEPGQAIFFDDSSISDIAPTPSMAEAPRNRSEQPPEKTINRMPATAMRSPTTR